MNIVELEEENRQLREALDHIWHNCDAYMEGSGEPEFSQFGWVVGRARRALGLDKMAGPQV